MRTSLLGSRTARRYVALSSRVAIASAIVCVGLATACSGDEGAVPAGTSGRSTTSTSVDGAGATTTGDASTSITGFHSERYADDANWLCRPESTATNYCVEADLGTTVLAADGSSEVVAPKRIEQGAAPVDCVYVYPTIPGIDFGGDPINDLEPLETLSPKLVVLNLQAARFTEACNVYAPTYRSLTMSGWSAEASARDEAIELAYGDVREAIHSYLANDNDGRPFVLIGHSQGSIHLARLLDEELEDEPAVMDRLVAAYLIGGDVHVAEGKDTGGSFDRLVLCREASQTGCVVAFNSYAADPPPDPKVAVSFGRDGEGTTAACTNPAALEGGVAELHPFLPESAAAADITTPFVSAPGGVEAECVSAEGYTYLAIGPTDALGDRLTSRSLENLGFWGLHLNESNFTQGDLLDLLRRQIDAFG